jgi:uncharacterized membrane protein YhaH (DUF805 family)
MQMNRKQFWAAVAVILVFKFGAVVASEFVPDLYAILRHVDNAAFVALLIVVAARFKDIGWPRWTGVCFLILVMAVLPVVLLFAVVKPPLGLPPAGVIDAMAQCGWVSTLLLLLFLIFAGTRPSQAAAPDANDQRPRREPTFG